MSTASRAVFLSYASEDAPAAQRIADALRAAGIEAWFDRQELRGGDAWDQKIRQQIRDCWLFVPIISAHSEARLEGYFRREWKLAVDRTEDMASEVAFLVPVVIDDTPNASAHVPERFRHVQWTRLREGEPTPAFVALVEKLLTPSSTASDSSPRIRAASDTAVAVAKTATSIRSPPARRRVAWVVGACAATLVVLAYIVGHKFTLSRHDVVLSGDHAIQNPRTITSAISIIVMPFANQTGDPQKTYIADAVTSSITSDLGRIEGAYVVPAQTAYTYNDKALSVQQVADAAHVRFVLSGNVQSAGTRIRVGVQLFDGFNAAQLWNRNFEGDVTDLFAMQDRVTTLVGNSTGREMVIAAARDIQSPGFNAAASDLLLHARALMLRPNSTANYTQIAEIYRSVLEREPRNPVATIGLARALVDAALLGLYAPKTLVRQKEMVAEAQKLADRARELELQAPDVDFVLGWCAFYRTDFRSAERWFHGFQDQVPNSPQTYNNFGFIAVAEFEPKKALEYFKRAAAVTPGPPDDYILLNSAVANLELGDYAAAIDDVEKCLAVAPHLDPAFGVAALAYALAGNTAAAAKWAEKAKAANVLPIDVIGIPTASNAYERWMQSTVLPAWRKLGLPELEVTQAGT